MTAPGTIPPQVCPPWNDAIGNPPCPCAYYAVNSYIWDFTWSRGSGGFNAVGSAPTCQLRVGMHLSTYNGRYPGNPAQASAINFYFSCAYGYAPVINMYNPASECQAQCYAPYPVFVDLGGPDGRGSGTSGTRRRLATDNDDQGQGHGSRRQFARKGLNDTIFVHSACRGLRGKFRDACAFDITVQNHTDFFYHAAMAQHFEDVIVSNLTSVAERLIGAGKYGSLAAPSGGASLLASMSSGIVGMVVATAALVVVAGAAQ